MTWMRRCASHFALFRMTKRAPGVTAVTRARKATTLSVWLHTPRSRHYRRKSTSLDDLVRRGGMPPSKIFLMPLDCYFSPAEFPIPDIVINKHRDCTLVPYTTLPFLLLLFLHLARGAGGQSRFRQIQLIPGSTLGRVLRFFD